VTGLIGFTFTLHVSILPNVISLAVISMSVASQTWRNYPYID